MLDILVCPESKQAVFLADRALVESLNAAIGEGTVVTRGGDAVDESIEEGLVREDRAFLYRVRDGIPIMLIDEAISLEQVPSAESGD